MTSDDSELRDLLGGALARIWPQYGGDPVGAGTLLAERRILTCAHVVNAATGASERTQDSPGVDVEVDFPFSREAGRFSARVTSWVPIDETGGGDVCVLTVLRSLPSDCRPAHLVESDGLNGHEFDVLGFPEGYPDGTEATGVLRGRNAAGWVQIQDLYTTGPRVRRGFSGAPVWDRTLAGVVGMVVTASDDDREKTAFAIPTSSIREQLDSAEQTEVVGAMTVAPSAVDMGELRAPAFVQARIRVEPATIGALEWTLQPDDGAFVIRPGRDCLVVEPDLDRVGASKATLTVGGSAARCRVALTVDVRSGPACEWWPPQVDEGSVHLALQGFAEASPLVPDDLFDGDVDILYRPVVRARITHVTERRTISPADSAEEPDLEDSYDGSLDTLEVDLPVWGSGSWSGVDRQSIVNVRCRACDSEHRVFCHQCRGSAKLDCLRQTYCPDCLGRGYLRQDEERMRCWTCSGSGRVTCPDCAGTGQKPCDTCADGKEPCPRCGGDGWYHHYNRGEVRHEARTVEARSEWAEPKLDLEDEDFLAVRVEDPFLGCVPEDLRDQLSAWVDQYLGPWQQDEIVRRLDVAVAPAVVVTYRRGRTEDKALVVGTRVRAPHAKRPGVWQIEHRLGSRLRNLAKDDSVQEGRERLVRRFQEISENETIRSTRDRLQGLADTDTLKGVSQRLRGRLRRSMISQHGDGRLPSSEAELGNSMMQENEQSQDH